jgi:hypothetical protein
MILGFEEITVELTDDECRLLPYLFKGFERRTKNNPIKARDICAGMNKISTETGVVLTEVRLRKICNFIRVKGMIPLIATSSGYYLSDDPEEIKKQIQSLKDRAGAILAGANGLEQYAKRKNINIL